MLNYYNYFNDYFKYFVMNKTNFEKIKRICFIVIVYLKL